MQKEIIDLSLKLDGRPFAGENAIFTKYSVTYFQISLLYFAATVLHLRKKNRDTKLTVKLGENYDTKGDTIVSKLFLNCD